MRIDKSVTGSFLTNFSEFLFFIFEKSLHFFNMFVTYHALEDRINQIINALFHDHYTNSTVAARAFDIAPRTLRRR